jgi:hypothetical protein
MGAMGFQRLVPIYSLHEDDPELSGSRGGVGGGRRAGGGLGEWIDALQDAHATGDLASVATCAGEHALQAGTLGYPGLRDAASDIRRAAEAGEAEDARKAIGDLIEIVQRVRLGHRSAA